MENTSKIKGGMMGLPKFRKIWEEKIAEAEKRYQKTGAQEDLDRLNKLKSELHGGGYINMGIILRSPKNDCEDPENSDLFLNPRFSTIEE